jgi:hypothetical protein
MNRLAIAICGACLSLIALDIASGLHQHLIAIHFELLQRAPSRIYTAFKSAAVQIIAVDGLAAPGFPKQKSLRNGVKLTNNCPIAVKAIGENRKTRG